MEFIFEPEMLHNSTIIFRDINIMLTKYKINPKNMSPCNQPTVQHFGLNIGNYKPP